MSKILSTISILIYTAYSQGCGNSHDVSTMISYSIHGPSVNGYIGADTYNTIVKDAAAAFTQGSNQKVGLTTFGGNSDVPGFVNSILSLTTGTGALVSTTIDAQSTPDYENEWGNVASGAINTARTALSGETNRQKYHVIFSATTPLATGIGDVTKPSNIDNPCGQSILAKQAGVQQYVALIGIEGINVFPSFWECVVEDPATDIITIDPASPSAGIALLKDRLCKPNGYDIKITEVKPNDDTDENGNGYNAYIEVLNRGAPADITAGFGTSYSSTSGTAIGTGEYFLARDNGGAATTANTVPAAQRASLPTSSPTASTWTARARVGTCSDEEDGCYDIVTYTGGSNDAVVAIQGRPFELRAIGYNNNYMGNWRNACYQTQTATGTPGADNLDECVPITAAATTTTTTIPSGSCGQVGVDGTCTANGDTNNACITDGSACECTTDYAEDFDTCAPGVLPVSTNGCVANIVKWWDGITYVIYQWPRVLYDGSVQYTMVDANSASSGTLNIAGYGRQYIKNAISDYNIDVTVQYSGFSGTVSNIACGTPLTQDPTPEPTPQPTSNPTGDPTTNPTPAPTFDSTGVYLGTAKPRADCLSESRQCCSPFGPQYGNTSTGNGGFVPSGVKKCEDQTQIIEIQSEDGDFFQEEFEFLLYPDGFTGATTVIVKLYSYGLINNSDFETLAFAGSYTEDGLIPDIITDANKFDWGIADTTRRRLQNGSNTNSYEYGNKLNIGVSPPGEGDNPWTGTITIPEFSDSASMFLNITTADLKCNEGDFDCTTLADCTSQSIAFVMVVQSCDNAEDDCKPLYPSTKFIAIRRATALCNINFGVGNQEDELPDWFWWVLIALIVFLLILAWLVYRFWWKQKKTAAELGDAEDELDQQIADNEAGFGKELDVGDVAFNPMATGVPGMNRPADAFGNELHQRQLQQQNDMVDVQAEIFQVRQDYGQVNTGNRHHQNGY